MSKPNVARGEVKVDIGEGITGGVKAGEKSLEDVVALAGQIWKEVVRAGVDVLEEDKCSRLLKKMQIKYKDFAESYPLILRYMVEVREYDSAAFSHYLKNHVKVMYKDRMEFRSAQGEYLVAMFRNKNPRAGGDKIKRYRESLNKAFKKEDDEFKEAQEEAKKEVARLDKENGAERRRLLQKFLENQKGESVS